MEKFKRIDLFLHGTDFILTTNKNTTKVSDVSKKLGSSYCHSLRLSLNLIKIGLLERYQKDRHNKFLIRLTAKGHEVQELFQDLMRILEAT